MIARRLAASNPAQRAAAGLRAYEAGPRHRPALACLYGQRLVTDRHHRLVNGPARLAVATAETLALVDPKTGTVRVEMPLEQLAAYYLDAVQGRILFRYDDGTTTIRLAGFRPLAAPDATLTTCQAAGLFVRQTTAAWEAHTGRQFANTWTAPTAAASAR